MVFQKSTKTFVRGYLMLLKVEPLGQFRQVMTTRLEELMEDVDPYGWEKVKAYPNAASLNQLKQKWTNWSDGEARMKLRRALVWHVTLTMKATGMGTMGGSSKNVVNSATTYSVPQKTNTKTCRAFNDIMCLKAQDHPQWQHMCAFCLKTTTRAYPHSETPCNRKKYHTQPQIA